MNTKKQEGNYTQCNISSKVALKLLVEMGLEMLRASSLGLWS